MADSSIDPISGYNLTTKSFHSLRPQIPLPPISKPLSITDYVTSLLNSTATSLESTTFLINAATDHRLTFSQFLSQTHSLSLSLKKLFPLAAGQTAFILSPPSLHIPVIYFALLSVGIVVSPANPLSSVSELTHQVQLSKPVIAFATSQTVKKLPQFQLGTILIDSPEFLSMLTQSTDSKRFNRDTDRVNSVSDRAPVHQSDVAAILYSSGTTGKVKGVMLTHRNLIAVISGLFHSEEDSVKTTSHQVSLFTLPLFHVFGFFIVLRAAAKGATMVLMERFEFEGMLKAVEKYRITSMPVSPPLIVAMAKSELVEKYDLSSLQTLGCGGAPLGKEVSERFTKRFPHVEIGQGYGMTETGGAATRMVGTDEYMHHGSAGRLSEYLEAKIVDPETGEHLGPGQRGELWLRGPTIMKGYVDNASATAETLNAEGWLKTGDLCYFDSEGFLFIIDRLKELIKYKAYQVPPAELEHLLQSNPEIADAAVIPYPDEDAGQIPMAFVVRKEGSNITASQVMDFVAKQVAPYKKIRRVAFVNSIPKSPAGKILRRDLVNLAMASHSSKL